MMDISTLYMIIHGLTTVGGLFTFLIRNENRMTKIETRLDVLGKQHDRLTNYGTDFHTFGDPKK